MAKDKKAIVAAIRTVISVGLCTGLALAYTFRTDALYALTIWPPFILVIPGVLILVYRHKGRRAWSLWLPLLGWLAFTAIFAEEPRTVVRGWLPAPQRPARGIRVITLNRASSGEAALETLRWKPDLILFQESPLDEEMKEVAKQLYGSEGSILSGPDCSIVARGRLEELNRSSFALNHVLARWTPPGEKPIIVVSLRLAPPVFRLDYWNPACWRDYALDRKNRRAELKALWQSIPDPTNDVPLLMGGDCNTPPDPGTFAPLCASLTDCFASAGRGWPGTAINDYPFARIDQIWVSPGLKPVSAWVVKTVHSDHRMVVVDLVRN